MRAAAVPLLLTLAACGGAELPPGPRAAPSGTTAEHEPAPQGGWAPFHADRATIKRLATPPFEYTLVKPAPVSAPGPAPNLVKVTQEPNRITDTEEWLRKNQLVSPVSPVLRPRAPVSPAPKRYILAPLASSAFSIIDPQGKVVSTLDFGFYSGPPAGRLMGQDLSWAEVEADVLYVSHRHMTYAAESAGLNAYITAVDVRTGELFWRSAPLVANAQNFILRGGYIITGYGFTAEPDFLFVLDQATGKTVSKIPLASGPELLIEKDGKLFVRTYDTNYVFDLR